MSRSPDELLGYARFSEDGEVGRCKDTVAEGRYQTGSTDSVISNGR